MSGFYGPRSGVSRGAQAQFKRRGFGLESPMATLYRPTPALRTDLDARDPSYRYDFEADIRWDQIDAPGTYAPQALMREIGVDVDGLLEHGAWELFEWIYALSICEEFIELERRIIQWCKTDTVVHTESLDWLRDEEIKHVKTFNRLRKHLLEQRPEYAEQTKKGLKVLHPPDAFWSPDADPATLHYRTWLDTLTFEEYTIHLYDELRDAEETIQPTWLDIHRCHAQEELVHVETDAEYVRALDLSPEARHTASQQSVSFLMTRFTNTFRAPAKILLELRPDLVGKVSPGKPPKAFMDVLLTAPAFARTRDCAPYLAWLGEKKKG
jgi:hypothetical protein